MFFKTRLVNKTDHRIDFDVEQGYCPLVALPPGKSQRVAVHVVLNINFNRPTSPIRVLINGRFHGMWLHPYRIAKMSQIVFKYQHGLLTAEGSIESYFDRYFACCINWDNRIYHQIAQVDCTSTLGSVSEPNKETKPPEKTLQPMLRVHIPAQQMAQLEPQPEIPDVPAASEIRVSLELPTNCKRKFVIDHRTKLQQKISAKKQCNNDEFNQLFAQFSRVSLNITVFPNFIDAAASMLSVEESMRARLDVRDIGLDGGDFAVVAEQDRAMAVDMRSSVTAPRWSDKRARLPWRINSPRPSARRRWETTGFSETAPPVRAAVKSGAKGLFKYVINHVYKMVNFYTVNINKYKPII
ncbi:uncharacterized protein LOC125214966 [Salvia hispanica]|uniref:uncharacterized protein LOC125214966 n=1 Tax=Salvia hispanica TaxID=49212 RepID=UPI002009238F|nr:uncharacterized protein LOC125214966 [Salvia hispanica]